MPSLFERVEEKDARTDGYFQFFQVLVSEKLSEDRVDTQTDFVADDRFGDGHQNSRQGELRTEEPNEILILRDAPHGEQAGVDGERCIVESFHHDALIEGFVVHNTNQSVDVQTGDAFGGKENV